MQLFFRIGHFVIGLVQFMAVWDAAAFFFRVEFFFGKIISFILAMFITFIPFLGSATAVYGAVNSWNWLLFKSLVLFFWYVPFYIVIALFSELARRKQVAHGAFLGGRSSAK